MQIKKFLKNLFLFSKPAKNEVFILKEEPEDILYDSRNENLEENEPTVNESYDENLQYIENRFDVPQNNDVIIRKLRLRGNRRAFLIFYDGMVDTDAVNESIIGTLLELPLLSEEKIYEKPQYIIEKLIGHSQAYATEKMESLIEDVNFGSCGLFVEGFSVAFVLDVRQWGHRSIDKPENEQSIYGPQEAFSEMLRNNSALVRKTLKTEKLICEGVKIGKISKTRGVLMYISDIANEALVSEVRRRLKSISVDFIVAIEEVGLLIEENSIMLTEQLLATERPDRTSRALADGRVALLLNGSPRALIFPTNVFELTHAASDAYMRVPYANMSRIIRLIAMFSSILLPGFYLAITLFHQELVPTYLLYSISAARENVPFPSVVELLLMDISFEMIREAGIRMPGPIGSTLGIVGGLILGQAAVSAKIVSPLMIIIIALTGIGSFATVDYSLSWSFRLLRLVFIVAGVLLGFYGIAVGIFMYSVFVAAKESFGVPFLAPLAKGKKDAVSGSLLVNPIWKRERRPEFLVPKKKYQEEKISRKWKNKYKDGD